MSIHQRVSTLLAWYAAGTLDDGDRALVENHVEQCPECHDALALALQQAELARDGNLDEHLEHLHPLLLVQFADDPAALDDDTRRYVQSRLDTCDACRGAYERLREVDEAIAREHVTGSASESVTESVKDAARALRDHDAAAPGPLRRFFDLLGATVLRPAPALAYLVMLAVLLPALWLSRDAADRPVLMPAPVLSVIGDTAVRSDGSGGQVAPAPLAVDAAQHLVQLWLVTGFDAAVLEHVESFEVALARDGRVIWRSSRSKRELVAVGTDLVLPLVFDASQLAMGKTYELTITAVAPGSLLDGKAIWKRGIVRRGEE